MNAKKIVYSLLTMVLAGAMYAAPAKADPITGGFSLTGADSCGNNTTGCPAATYGFNITTTSATLTIHIDGAVTAGVNDHIFGVDLGFAPSNTLTGASLSSVSGLGNSLGLWATQNTGSLSNGGCGGNGGAFVCASSTTPVPDGVLIAQGNTYSWTWTFNAIDPSKIDAAGDVHVGANYDPHNGLIVSTTQNTEVPEPATITMLIAGLGGLFSLAIVARRTVTQS